MKAIKIEGTNDMARVYTEDGRAFDIGTDNTGEVYISLVALRGGDNRLAIVGSSTNRATLMGVK